MTELTDNIKAALDKATPGKYVVGHTDSNRLGNITTIYVCQEHNGTPGGVVAGCILNCLTETEQQTRDNAAYFAAVCPANMRLVLAELDTQKKLSAQWFKSFSNAVSLGSRYEERIAELEAQVEQLKAVNAAAERLVRCKGRYHSEQNYRALAALFGLTTPDLSPLGDESRTVKLPQALMPAQHNSGELFMTPDNVEHGGYLNRDDVLRCLRVAGIKWEAE